MTDKKILALGAGLLVLAALAGAALTIGGGADKSVPSDPPDMTFTWDPPTTGTPVVRYEVEIRVGGSDSDQIDTQTVNTNEVTFAVDWVTPYEVRVRGVDGQGRTGPWSEWSLAYDTDLDDPPENPGG
jgi:hypothetical protein